MNIQPDKKAIRREFDIVGKRTVRPDGIDKVTGRARFGADMSMPGMLWGLVLRSPHAHARIKRIDTSKAEKLNGVHAIVTAQNFPGNNRKDRFTSFGHFSPGWKRTRTGSIAPLDSAGSPDYLYFRFA